LSHTDAKAGDTLQFHPVEVLCPANGDLNALLKRLAEKLLPLLGQNRLGLFCASGTIPVALQLSQIEDILNLLFIHAKDQMQPGGMAILQTAHFRFPGRTYTNSQGEIVSHVGLTFRYRANANGSSERLLQDIGSSIEEIGGLVDFDCSSPHTKIQIYLPAAAQSELLQA
jgi:hypothetical protein